MNVKKALVLTCEAVLFAILTCELFRDLKIHGGFASVGASVILMIIIPTMLTYIFLRIWMTKFSGTALIIAGIADNAYLSPVSALTVKGMDSGYKFLYILTMFLLNMLLRIKVLETDFGSHADMKKVLMWSVIAMIQAAGPAIVLTS
ncbi:hypothetical protein SAMN02910447_01338 [Ruminococcus sp. YE71]|uniref:hypothetical protein n=1 Tax=unclassified Ruminococcus TaxID=2608920 RepID=UPI0008927612|nr:MULTISPECIES: hypothetical protein [unclassified Ruminococcus]SDA17571.1 hypothetical protein SAMN02910446_01337 [Ruminococcus sp. YE78]SFW27028.1 hypothetical protein SAMN02910447_01338 [Ruminococcus sp. YE71]